MNEESVLVIDGSLFFASVLKENIAYIDGITVDVARSLAQADDLLQSAEPPYLCAVAGLVLPDALNGEAVDLCLDADIPVIVLTGAEDPHTRKRLLGKKIFDYVTKSQDSVEHVCNLIRRLHESEYAGTEM